MRDGGELAVSPGEPLDLPGEAERLRAVPKLIRAGLAICG